MGDSAQGKTETTVGMQRHYGLGEKVESKNASVAGLLGGLTQIAGRWFVTWGKVPLNDKRLVILEELKGASTETISKLTDMRSSGIAEIDKIEKRRTHARTRLIALSNPRSEVTIASYNYGIEAIKELIGSPEDIRRFDFAMIVSATQIDASVINKLASHRPQVPHVHTSALCRRLVLWAWTRDNVIFEDERQILDAATKLSNKYSDVVPLVDRGSMRLKLARLATALACRTFSTDDMVNVVVRKCHVDYVVSYLERLYDDNSFGYKDFSDAYEATRRMVDPDAVRKAITVTPFPNDFIDAMLYTTRIELRDIQDWCGWERGEATELLSIFVRKHALIRQGRAYLKTPEFIALLKELAGTLPDRPSHIPEM